jgi:hypothetical protein
MQQLGRDATEQLMRDKQQQLEIEQHPDMLKTTQGS